MCAGSFYFLLVRTSPLPPRPPSTGVDVKMFLYLAGAVMLQLNLLSAVPMPQPLRAGSGAVSLAMQTYVGCFGWFLVEYLLGEQVHLYTYDLFAEKVGMKLTWGCLFFYPFFYCIGVHTLVSAPPTNDITPAAAVAVGALYLTGWFITRGANLQKYFFKTQVWGCACMCICMCVCVCVCLCV